MIPIPQPFLDAVDMADASWRPVLLRGLDAVAAADPAYLPALAGASYLPTRGRLFAAFMQPRQAVRYVLVGEGPYPREESATGVCFMDGAVEALWSDKGLSKQVNRATSLRNFMKMLLVADGMLAQDNTAGDALAAISQQARADGSPFIQSLPELQARLLREGFLLLNAALVFRHDMPPVREARAWRPFLDVVLRALLEEGGADGMPPMLVLWGKIAEQLDGLAPTAGFPKVVSEHPYNLTFISNAVMQDFFRPMRLLFRKDGTAGV